MSRIRFPRTATLAALLVLANGLVLPPEHVHYVPDGEHAAVVHRHLSAHVASSTAIHGPEDADHIQELRDVWLPGRPFLFPQVVATAINLWDGIATLAARESVVVGTFRIDHGPPIPLRVLRGPPASA